MRDPKHSPWEDGLLMNSYLKTRREERASKESEMKDSGMKEEAGNFSVHQPV